VEEIAHDFGLIDFQLVDAGSSEKLMMFCKHKGISCALFICFEAGGTHRVGQGRR
jgi:hypothetical protein